MADGSRMVFLGFGKYARADRIYALQPITGDSRGGGQRTLVWVEGVTDPVIASRTERTILHDMGQDASAGSPLRRPGSARAQAAGVVQQVRRVLAAVLKLARQFFARSVHEVAPELIGVTLLVDGVGGRIVEVEAYDAQDPAAHSFRGRTPRNASMFGPPGHAYVYRSYGIHWCLNLVCQEEGSAAAVLIRALEPTDGLDLMRERRGLDDVRLLAAGPGRLCEALGVTRGHDGLPLDAPPFELLAPPERPEVAAGTRIGISVATDLPWRYVEAESRWLSRPLRSRASVKPPVRP
jgi:DNA-3-methyladenine glycosylase